jgi:glycosyltransferase involved in cell wall biosynthesis
VDNSSSDLIFDVVMLTKNSMPYLKESIPSVYRSIPVNRLLLVDGGSTDGGIEYARSFPRVEVIADTGTRATARQRGIEAVETEWHVHVDSDVILSDNWMQKMRKNLDASTVGAVWGVTYPVGKTYTDILRALAMLYRTSMMEIQIRQARYLLHDTVIRTSAVKGISIPPDYHVQEDQFIGDHIVSKGYRWLKVAEPFCYHKLAGRSELGFKKEAILSGYMYHKYHMRTFRSIARNAIYSIPKSLWIFLYTVNPAAMRRHLITQTLPVKGWLMYDDNDDEGRRSK